MMQLRKAYHTVHGTRVSTTGFWIGMVVTFILGWLGVNGAMWRLSNRNSTAPFATVSQEKPIPVASRPAVNAPLREGGIRKDVVSGSQPGPMAAPDSKDDFASVPPGDWATPRPVSVAETEAKPRDAYRRTLDALSALYE